MTFNLFLGLFPQPSSSGQSATLPPPTVQVINATEGTLTVLPASAELLSSEGTERVTSEVSI